MSIRFSDRLSVKQAKIAVIVAFGLGLIFSFVQVVLDFRNEQAQSDATMHQILNAVRHPASQASYRLDPALAKRVISGLFEYQFIIDAEISNDFNQILATAKRAKSKAGYRWISSYVLGDQIKAYTLELFVEEHPPSVGLLRVWVDIDLLFESYFDRIGVILILGLFRSLLLAAILTTAFYLLLTRRLEQLTNLVSAETRNGTGGAPTDLPKPHSADELSVLTAAFNQYLTEQKQHFAERETAEQVLRESEQRYRQAARLIKIGYWVWDEIEGKCIYSSEEHAEIYGVSVEEYLQRSSSLQIELEWIHRDDRQHYESVVKEAVEKRTGYETTYRIVRDDGQVRYLHEVADSKLDADGKLVQTIGTLQDFTERNELETQLRQSQKMESVGQLTGGIAHDFNNILGVILGNSDLLMERLPADDIRYRALVEPITHAAERGAELIRGLLAFSRKQPLDPKVINLNKHIDGMLSMLQRALSETIEIEFAPAGGLWTCLVDPGQVEHALLNLCINAGDAMSDGGKLIIETANMYLDDHYVETHVEVESGRYVMLAVTDTGTGMSQEVIEKAFEPFFTTKDLGKGTGLGLSMVYGFARQSNGHAAIYSEPGEGTTVRLYLPQSSGSVVDEVQPVSSASLKVSDKTVLVVEDDGAMRELTVLMLTELGYRVLEADSGDSALSQLNEASHIDLLLSDVVIPGKPTGEALVREAIVHHADIKTIFMSGYAENAVTHQGRIDPGLVLLQKPFTKFQLAFKVRNIFDMP